jgi:hypothetical protein
VFPRVFFLVDRALRRAMLILRGFAATFAIASGAHDPT